MISKAIRGVSWKPARRLSGKSAIRLLCVQAKASSLPSLQHGRCIVLLGSKAGICDGCPFAEDVGVFKEAEEDIMISLRH